MHCLASPQALDPGHLLSEGLVFLVDENHNYFNAQEDVDVLKIKGSEAKCTIVLFPNLAQPFPEEPCHRSQEQLPTSIYVTLSKNLVWQPKQRGENVPPGWSFIKGSRCSRDRPKASRFCPNLEQGTLQFGKSMTSLPHLRLRPLPTVSRAVCNTD